VRGGGLGSMDGSRRQGSFCSDMTDASEEVFVGALSRAEQEAVIQEELSRAQTFMDHNVMIEAKRNFWTQQQIDETNMKMKNFLQKEMNAKRQMDNFRGTRQREREASFGRKNQHAQSTLQNAKKLAEDEKNYAIEKNYFIMERTKRGLQAKSQAEDQYRDTLRRDDHRRQQQVEAVREQIRREHALYETMIDTPWEVFFDLKDDADPVVRNMARRALTKKRTDERIRLRKEARNILKKAREVQQMGRDYGEASEWRKRTAEAFRSPGPGAYSLRSFDEFAPPPPPPEEDTEDHGGEGRREPEPL